MPVHFNVQSFTELQHKENLPFAHMKTKVQISCPSLLKVAHIWLETHCPGILVTPRLFRFYLNKSDPIRILSH